MNTTNRHLNLFKFFSQNQSNENIEDNLSRALVLCLKNNTLLFHEFIQSILTQSKSGEENIYNYLFSNYNENENLVIDIQKDVVSLDDSDFKYVFAIAITSKNLEMLGFLNYKYKANKNYKPITDILITIKDVVFVVEVKRWGEDCRQQLYNQLHQLTNNNIDPNRVFPISYDWNKIMDLVSKVSNFQKLNNNPDYFLEDFIHLIRSFNTNWLPVIPFASISDRDDEVDNRKKRLEATIYEAGDKLELLEYNNRVGFKLDFGWAQEILCNFTNHDGVLYLEVYVWPGNTKSQGWKVFYSDKIEKLHENKQFKYKNQEFDVVINNEIKLCHFNKYITEIDFSDKDTIKPIVTTKNFEKYAGKHNRENWNNLENFFDSGFNTDFNWRERCKWNEKFVNTNRNYLTLSIGYEISVRIPYNYLQSIDKKSNDRANVADLLIAIHQYYKGLL